jgi:hypothetical protein
VYRDGGQQRVSGHRFDVLAAGVVERQDESAAL